MNALFNRPVLRLHVGFDWAKTCHKGIVERKEGVAPLLLGPGSPVTYIVGSREEEIQLVYGDFQKQGAPK